MFYKTLIFSCDHPGCIEGLNSKVEFTSIQLAREYGWAISRDRKYCYCPKCAPMHRNVGRYSYFGNGNLQANGSKYKLL